MNNNNFTSNNSEDIGIDPTTVPIIDVLDLGEEPKELTEDEKKKNKGKDLLTKILFSLGVLVLMGLVAFGLYYYLSLGKKKDSENKSFALENQKVYVGATLSDSILDYGDFAKIDVSACSLDTSGVDTSTAGEYEYSMVCDGAKYTAKITVVEKFAFEITSKIAYKYISGTISNADFVTDKNDYVYSYVNQDEVLNRLYTAGGPYLVELNVTDTKGKKGVVTSVLFVTETESRSFLRCSKEQTEKELNYTVTDVFPFDGFRNYLRVPSRVYDFTNLKEEEYISLVDSIEGGKVTIGDITGFAIRDDANYNMKIVVPITDEDLTKEAGSNYLTSYSDIESYYKKNEYTCSNR